MTVIGQDQYGQNYLNITLLTLVMAARKSETDPQEMYEMMIDLLSWYYCTQMYCYEAMLQKRIVSHQTQSTSSDYNPGIYYVFICIPEEIN
jgi:hypothetical protein